MVRSFHRPLNAEEKNLIREAAINIENNFQWDSTEEGFDYWQNVTSKLRNIANQVDVCEKCGQEIK